MRARASERCGDARGGERVGLLSATASTAAAARDGDATTRAATSVVQGVGAIAVDIPPSHRDAEDDVERTRAPRRGYGRVGALVSIAACACAFAAFGVRERGARAGGARVGAAARASEVDADASTTASAGLRAPPVREVAFLTYSDRVTAGVCMTGETAAMNGIPLHMIGVDRENGLFDFSNVDNHKTRKLFAFLKVLDDSELASTYGIADDTIVSIGDATDVLYFRPSEDIVSAYKELETLANSAQGVVVVSSERNCWPWMLNGKERIPGGVQKCAEYPQDVGTSFKYLNSGNLIGRASALRSLLKDVIDRMHNVNEDDQQILAEAYLRQVSGQGSTEYTIVLDPKQQIFQTAWETALETPMFDRYAQSDAWYDREETTVKNQETSVHPAIVHFNGAKANLVPVGQHYMKYHTPVASYEQIKHEVETRYAWFHDVCAAINEKLKNPALEIAFTPEQAQIIQGVQSYLGRKQ